MERWQDKVAVVTGASCGEGAAIATKLLENGFFVVALSRHLERLITNQKALPENLQIRYQPKKCDITDEEEVISTFGWIEHHFGGTDVLVHNTGLMTIGVGLSSPNNAEIVESIIQANVMSVVFCVREAFNSMYRRKVDGHIIIINSVLGHKVPALTNRSINIYPASKFAVTAMLETYRQEFANTGTKVKVTSITLGEVEPQLLPYVEVYRAAGLAQLYPEDVTNAILYALGTPPHVQVHEIIIKPMGANL